MHQYCEFQRKFDRNPRKGYGIKIFQRKFDRNSKKGYGIKIFQRKFDRNSKKGYGIKIFQKSERYRDFSVESAHFLARMTAVSHSEYFTEIIIVIISEFVYMNNLSACQACCYH